MIDGRLRMARIDDAAEIARLAGELGYPTTASDMTARLSRLLPLSTHRVCVIDARPNLLGWIALERRMVLDADEHIEIVDLVVSATARQGGVGRVLVEEAERWARASGVMRITVRSNITRDASHPFYERMGYVRYKTQHVYARVLDPG